MLTGMPAELVELGGLLQQHLLGFPQQVLHLSQRLANVCARRCGVELLLEAIQSTQALALHSFEALHGGQVRLEPLGLDQRLARQIEQAVEALGGYPQYPFAAFGHTLASERRRSGLHAQALLGRLQRLQGRLADGRVVEVRRRRRQQGMGRRR
jgi:hypothetical protein